LLQPSAQPVAPTVASTVARFAIGATGCADDRLVYTLHSTGKNILIECVDLNDVRNKHFVVSSIKDVFNNVEAQKIVDFIFFKLVFYKQLQCLHINICYLFLF